MKTVQLLHNVGGTRYSLLITTALHSLRACSFSGVGLPTSSSRAAARAFRLAPLASHSHKPVLFMYLLQFFSSIIFLIVAGWPSPSARIFPPCTPSLLWLAFRPPFPAGREPHRAFRSRHRPQPQSKHRAFNQRV